MSVEPPISAVVRIPDSRITAVIELDGKLVAGGSSAPAFEFHQDTPAATWTVTHGLGRLPVVDVYIDGELVETDVESSATVTTITFPAPYAGVAVLF